MRLRKLTYLLAISLFTQASLCQEAGFEALQKGDFKTALAELLPFAEKGEPHSQWVVGMIYDKGGDGVTQDQGLAAAWYRKSAEQGHVYGQLYLAILYYSGEGVNQDYFEAAKWFKPPAEFGDPNAQFYLARMYSAGEGVDQNDSLAVAFFDKSSRQRNTRAMGLLSTHLFGGKGVQRNLVMAYVWSHLAAEMDPLQAMLTTRLVIAKYCSEEQIDSAKVIMQELKNQWLKNDQQR